MRAHGRATYREGMSEQQGPPAGWYPHPDMTGTVRYWNGSAFTGDTAPAPHSAGAAGPISPSMRQMGWVCAFVFPIVGFVIGCIAASRGPKNEGTWMLVTSVVVQVLWISFWPVLFY